MAKKRYFDVKTDGWAEEQVQHGAFGTPWDTMGTVARLPQNAAAVSMSQNASFEDWNRLLNR